MKHSDRMIEWFKFHDNKATLGEILQSGEPWAYEFRARATDLRHQGFVITCLRNKMPSDNLYTVYEPEPSGQLRMA